MFEQPRGDADSLGSSAHRITYDDRLNHILEAATLLIARVGYQNASMREVAKAADVSLAGIYHYFDSKEKMLFLIQSRSFSALLNHLLEKLHGVTDPAEQLGLMVRTHVEYFAANMAALKVCSHELDSLSGEDYDHTHAIRRRYYDETRKIIDRLFETYGVNGGIDRHVATMYLFGALNWLYRWYDPKRDRPPSSIARQITTQFLNGIIHAPSIGRSSHPAPRTTGAAATITRRRRQKASGRRNQE